MIDLRWNARGELEYRWLFEPVLGSDLGVAAAEDPEWKPVPVLRSEALKLAGPDVLAEIDSLKIRLELAHDRINELARIYRDHKVARAELRDRFEKWALYAAVGMFLIGFAWLIVIAI